MLLVLSAIIFVLSSIFMIRNRMFRKPENTLSKKTKRRNELKEQRKTKNMILKSIKPAVTAVTKSKINSNTVDNKVFDFKSMYQDNAGTSNSHVDNEFLYESGNENIVKLNISEESSDSDESISTIDSDCEKSIVKKNPFQEFKTQLISTFLNANISHSQGDKLLATLRTHPCFVLLPKSTKTLLNTPRETYQLHQEPTYTNLTTNNITTEKDVVEKKLDTILERQDIILKSIENIEAKVTAIEKINNPDIDDFELPDGFPMKSMDDFDQFEKDTNKSRAVSLRNYLRYNGGTNLRVALHNFVRAAMTDELAVQFTWTGKSGPNAPPKRKLKGTKMVAVFQSAAKRIKKIQDFTLDEFIDDFTEVLRSYKQTSKNSKKKKANQSRNEEESYVLLDDGGDENTMR